MWMCYSRVFEKKGRCETHNINLGGTEEWRTRGGQCLALNFDQAALLCICSSRWVVCKLEESGIYMG